MQIPKSVDMDRIMIRIDEKSIDTIPKYIIVSQVNQLASIKSYLSSLYSHICFPFKDCGKRGVGYGGKNVILNVIPKYLVWFQ